jgi:CBS domain-containing protein
VLVKDVMKREVATVGPDASLGSVARAMRDHDVGCLPVLENGRLIGMITDRDIVVRGVAEGLDPHRAIVREAMSGGRGSLGPGPPDRAERTAQSSGRGRRTAPSVAAAQLRWLDLFAEQPRPPKPALHRRLVR